MRYPVYAEADVIVDCGDEPPDHTTAGVMNALLDWKPARRLHVVLPSTSYDVVIGDNLLARAGALLAPKLPQKRAVVITDQNVAGLHLQTLMDGLAQTAIPASSIVVKGGEASKNMDTYTGRRRPAAGSPGRAPHRGHRPGRRRGRRPGRLRRRHDLARPAVHSDPDHPAVAGRIRRSAARPASTRGAARTWSAPSTSREWCSPTPARSAPCRRAN